MPANSSTSSASNSSTGASTNVFCNTCGVSPSIHSSTSAFLQIAPWCALLLRCTKSNCLSNNVLEIGKVCFLRISSGSIPTNTASKLSAKSLGGNSLMAGSVGACSTMVVTPSSPNAECDRSHGFLLLAVKNTFVRITLRKGNNILCPYGILRINSGCRPSHFPLAKARTGISGGFLTKHRLHSLHIGACSSPVHMRCVTRRLCKSICTF